MADKVKAVWATLQQMKKNLECSICLELLKDPHSTNCNHQFCRQCIHQVIEKGSRKVKNKCSCPLCKTPVSKRSLTPNAQLGEIVVAVRHLCDAVQKDTGVAGSPPSLSIISSSISGTPGCVQFHEMHPTPQKTVDDTEVHQVSASQRSVTKEIGPKTNYENKGEVQVFIEKEADSDGHIHRGNKVITNTNVCTSFPSVETSEHARKSKSVRPTRRLRRTQRKTTVHRENKTPEDNKELLHMIDTMPLGLQSTTENSPVGHVEDYCAEEGQRSLNKATTKAKESDHLKTKEEVVGPPSHAVHGRNDDGGIPVEEPPETVGCSTLLAEADSSVRSPAHPDLPVEKAVTFTGDTAPEPNTEVAVSSTNGDASTDSTQDTSQSVSILPSLACVRELDEKDGKVAVSSSKGDASTDSTQDTSQSVSILPSLVYENDCEVAVSSSQGDATTDITRDTSHSVSILQSLAREDEPDREKCDVCLLEELEENGEREAQHVDHEPPMCVSPFVARRNEGEACFLLQEGAHKTPPNVPLETRRESASREGTVGQCPDTNDQFDQCPRDGSSLRIDKSPEYFGKEFETRKHSSLQDRRDLPGHKIEEMVQLAHSDADAPVNISPEDRKQAESPDMYERIKNRQRSRESEALQVNCTKQASEFKGRKRSRGFSPDLSQDSTNCKRSLSKKLRNSTSPLSSKTCKDVGQGADTINSDATGDHMSKDQSIEFSNSSEGAHGYQAHSNHSSLSNTQPSSSLTGLVPASVSSAEFTDIFVIDPMVPHTSGRSLHYTDCSVHQDNTISEAAGSSARRDNHSQNSLAPGLSNTGQMAESQPFLVTTEGEDFSPSPAKVDADDNVNCSPSSSTNGSTDDWDSPSPCNESCQHNYGFSRRSTPSQKPQEHCAVTPCLFGSDNQCGITVDLSSGKAESNTLHEPAGLSKRGMVFSEKALHVGETQGFSENSETVSDCTMQSISLLLGLEIPDEDFELHEKNDEEAFQPCEDISAKPSTERLTKCEGFKSPHQVKLNNSNDAVPSAVRVVHLCIEGETQESDVIPPTPPIFKCNSRQVSSGKLHSSSLNSLSHLKSARNVSEEDARVKFTHSQEGNLTDTFNVARHSSSKRGENSHANPKKSLNSPRQCSRGTPSSNSKSRGRSGLVQGKGRALHERSLSTRTRKKSPDTPRKRKVVASPRNYSETSVLYACDEADKLGNLSGRPCSSSRVPEISEQHSESLLKTAGNDVDLASPWPSQRNEDDEDMDEDMDEDPLADHVLPNVEKHTTEANRVEECGPVQYENSFSSVQSKTDCKISRISCDEDRGGSDSDEDELLLRPVFLPQDDDHFTEKVIEMREGATSQAGILSCEHENEEDDGQYGSRVSCSGQMTNRSAASSTFLSEAPVTTQKVELLRQNVHETEEEIIALRAFLSDLEKVREAQSDHDDSQEPSQDDVQEELHGSPSSPTPPSSLTPEIISPVTSLPSPVKAIARLLEEDDFEESEDEEENSQTEEECSDERKGSREKECGTMGTGQRSSPLAADDDVILTKVCHGGRETTPYSSWAQRLKKNGHSSEDDLVLLDDHEPLVKPAPSSMKRRRLIDDSGATKSPAVSFLFRESVRDACRTPSPLPSRNSRVSHGKRATILLASQDDLQGNTSSARREAGQPLSNRPVPSLDASRVVGPKQNCGPSESPTKRLSTWNGANCDNGGRTFSFVATRLNRQQLNEIRRIAEVWGGKLAREFNSKTTHVVMATDSKMKVTKNSYTMKYLLGLALGKWIVSQHWIAACLQAKSILPEEQYEVQGDPNLHQSQTPRLARIARERKDPLLFADYRVLCVGKFTSSVTKAQLTQLLDFCGAEVCHSASDMASHGPSEIDQKQQILIADKSDRAVKHNRGLCRIFDLLPVSLEWVTDSIANYRIQDIKEYIIKV